MSSRSSANRITAVFILWLSSNITDPSCAQLGMILMMTQSIHLGLSTGLEYEVIGTLLVCPVDQANHAVSLHGVQQVVSLMSPGDVYPMLSGIEEQSHLKLCMVDSFFATGIGSEPKMKDVKKLIEFAKHWDRRKPMLLHCAMGISRSTAAAYITMCLLDQRNELECAYALRQASSFAKPNRLLVAYADFLLGRKGKMIHALDIVDEGTPSVKGVLFSICLTCRP